MIRFAAEVLVIQKSDIYPKLVFWASFIIARGKRQVLQKVIQTILWYVLKADNVPSL